MHLRLPFISPRPRLTSIALAALAALAALLAACTSAPPVQPPPATVESSVPVVGVTPAQPAVNDIARQADFARWVADFRATARAAGIDEATLHVALDDVRELPRVIELDRAQPEFTRNVWDYLDSAVSPQRVVLGRDKLAQVRAEADSAATRYGVPAAILVAVWGIESNYGSNYGDIPTIDALATLGFEGRRGEWARGQLITALKILQSGDIDRRHMVGSWAGAMGQTQFLPSAFVAYAVDADGDGRRDIWGSMADVMASTANYLARSGWRTGEGVLVEVRLPGSFDVGRADELRQPVARWASEGVRVLDGSALPELGDASVWLPAGARGPAFLVGSNFRSILRYNNSTSYALAVGLLAQRIGGGAAVQGAWPRDLAALSRSQLIALQSALNERGFDAGVADGMMGPATRAGLRRYQRSVGLPADGYPDSSLLQRLQP